METLSTLAFSTLLYGIAIAMKFTAWRHPAFRERLKEQNLIGQIRVKQLPTGRYYIIKDGKVSSRSGIHPNPDVVVAVKSARLGFQIFTHPNDQLGRINAAKSFSMTLDGPQDKAIWFMFTLEAMMQAGWRYGVEIGNGETRYANMANGGPLYVYVKDGKIVRMTPIEFDDDDPQPWTIKAKGKEFTPPRKTSLAPRYWAYFTQVLRVEPDKDNYGRYLKALSVGHASAQTAKAVREMPRELLSFMVEDPKTISRAIRLSFVAKYLERMGDVFVELRRVLRPGRYATVIVRDAYQDGRYRFTGSDLAARADAAGLVPKGDLVWYQAGTRLRPYGYPHAFVPNIVHQHILVFRAE